MKYKLVYGNDYDGREETEHDSISDALNSIGEGRTVQDAIEVMRKHDEYSGYRGQNFWTLTRIHEEVTE